jgi:hypothetical protein
MSPAITGRQRDALYGQILERLSGIGDVWLAAASESYETAGRLGREYCDDLRLVLDDLGWGEGPGGTIELKTPPDVLRRAFTRLRDGALASEASQRQERAEAQESQRRNQLVIATCRELLAELEGSR